MDKKAKPEYFRAVLALGACVAFALSLYGALRFRPSRQVEYDAAFWPAKKVESGSWTWCVTHAGIVYNLYIPEGLDRDDATATIPLIVCFHGSTGKATSKDQLGRLFANERSQAALDPNGAAVLVPHSRIEYFSDPDGYARLIDNVILEHPCVDPDRVALYGFSQGAAFVHELAMRHPGLARAAATGSSYYSAGVFELFRGARVKFWSALSRNDAGIYEQGVRTARTLAFLCPDSRYVEYDRRGHFFIEPGDRSGSGAASEHDGETFIEWLSEALAR